MNNNKALGNLINILLLVVGLVATFCTAMLIYTVVKNPEGHKSEAISHNMFFVNKKSDTEVRYYNGNGFIEINPSTTKTKNLSSHYNIAGVSQVFWLDFGVVFATQEVGEYSDLRPVINEVLANDAGSQVGSAPTYWFLSFESNRIQAINANVMQPEMFGVTTSDGNFLFKDDAGSYSLLTKSGEITYGVINLDQETRPVYATSNSLLYAIESPSSAKSNRSENAIELRKIKFYKEDSELITKNIFNDGVGSIYSQISVIDPTHFAIVRSEKDNKIGGDLYILDTDSGKHKKVIDSFDGQVFKSKEGVIALKQGRSADVLHTINKDGVVQRLRVSKDHDNVPLGIVTLGNGYLVSQKSGKTTIVSKDGAAMGLIKPTYAGSLEKQLTDIPNTVSVSRDIESVSDTSYSITFNGKISDAITAIRSATVAKGYDPNQFTFQFVPGRLAEF